MKKVYICSPYASQGNREQNVRNAIGYCKTAILRGYLPIAPHVFYTQMLNDDIEEERAAGFLVRFPRAEGDEPHIVETWMR